MRRAGIQPELLLLMGGALVLAALVGPLIWKQRLVRRQQLTQAGARALAYSASRFYSEYGIWPTRRTRPPADVRFGREIPNAEVLRALMGVEGAGNEGHGLNTFRTPFFRPPAYEPGRAGIDPSGEFLDPWGTPYQIVLDTSLNGQCDVPDSMYDGFRKGGVLVWSCGPDRRSDTRDDIRSWTP